MIWSATAGVLAAAQVALAGWVGRRHLRRIVDRPPSTRPAGELGASRWLVVGWLRSSRTHALAGVLAVSLGVLTVGVGGTVTASVAVLVVEHVRRRSARRARHARILMAVPDLADLFVIAASAGHPVARSLEVVAPRAPGALRLPLQRSVTRLARGLPLDACLRNVVAELGPAVLPLVDVLRQSASTGAGAVPPLSQVAAQARDARRRAAQAAARRLPVLLLVPLAGCILPAAVLLAVVPVVLVSLASLSG